MTGSRNFYTYRMGLVRQKTPDFLSLVLSLWLWRASTVVEAHLVSAFGGELEHDWF